MKLTTFAVLLLLCSFVKGQGVDTCTPFKDDPACGCTLQDGKVIDLSGLGRQDHQPAFKAVLAEGVTYTYNPCYPYTLGGCANVAGCQQSGGEDRPLGVQGSVHYSENGDDIVINYDGGVDNRTFQVTLKCRQGGNDFAFNEEEPSLHYKFTLTTQCACPDNCKGGGGGGGGSRGTI